jgi:hypothetical protein
MLQVAPIAELIVLQERVLFNFAKLQDYAVDSMKH